MAKHILASALAGLLMMPVLGLAAPPSRHASSGSANVAAGAHAPALQVLPTPHEYRAAHLPRTPSAKQSSTQRRLSANTVSTPVIAIVIDDLGYQRRHGLHALELPGAITYAVLPHTPHGSSLARLAHSLDKEIIIHLPMEARNGTKLGPGGLTANLSLQSFIQRAHAAIDSIPFAKGVSNHMGSRLTQMPKRMNRLMALLQARENWLFFDSRTTGGSVAESTAHNYGLQTTSRDVFLDNDKSRHAIRAQFDRLLSLAHQRGSAVAIGHPYPQTMSVLNQQLPRLREQGVKLVSLSELITERSKRLWRVAQSSGQAAMTR